MKTTIKYVLAVVMVGFLTASCDNGDDAPTTKTLKLNIENLAMLESDEQYEGWIIVDGKPMSTGVFTVDASGVASQTEFMVDIASLDRATDFVLSIEPMPDNDPMPSSIKILGGSFSGTSATVSVAHGAALGNDFSDVSGKYILATPSTSTMEDENSGVWYLSLATGMPSTGLMLPTLPSGWKYEAWTVINGMPISTGTFSHANMADDAAPYTSTGDTPPFPGEDFIMNAPAGISFPTDLSGTTMVISIEPHPDNSAKPFAFKPLVGVVPAMAKDHFDYMMMNNVNASFPKGTVMR